MIMQLEAPQIQFIADMVDIPACTRDRYSAWRLWRRCFDGRGTGFSAVLTPFFRAPPVYPGVERQFFGALDDEEFFVVEGSLAN